MNINASNLKSNWRTIAAWTSIAIGALVLVIGWFGVSGETLVAKQLPYLISGGVGGLAFLAVGVGLLIAEARATRVG